MIQTEKQAKTKLCPFARGFNASMTGYIINNDINGGWPSQPMCIGSECMGWNWIDPEMEYVYLYEAQEVYPHITDIEQITSEMAENCGWRKSSTVPGSYEYPRQDRRGECCRTLANRE